ncbi:MAG TPA: hypothetical protein VKY74_05545, partial [Chloroflexia bacterium]|nr:hypothetical protein [Chloroflexia bacterium]
GVGLDEIPLESSAGRLAGGETLFTFYTEHGGEHPTTLLGPGPRPGTAATAVFADIASLL